MDFEQWEYDNRNKLLANFIITSKDEVTYGLSVGIYLNLTLSFLLAYLNLTLPHSKDQNQCFAYIMTDLSKMVNYSANITNTIKYEDTWAFI